MTLFIYSRSYGILTENIADLTGFSRKKCRTSTHLVFDRLRGLDDVGFRVALALAGLGLARRVLGLADDVCDRGVEQEGCGVGA